MSVLDKTESTTRGTKGILDSAGARKHYQLERYQPSAELTPFIEYFWIVRWDLPAGESYTTEILPFPNVNISITDQESTITGVVTAKFTYQLTGAGTIVGAKFLPGGFYPFYKKPIEKLTNQKISLKTVFQAPRIKKIVEQLPTANDAELIALAEKMLLAKKPVVDDTVAAIEDIITTIKDDPSIRQVQKIAELYDVSERSLQYAFKNYVGIGLKWIISRYRLQDVADDIDGGATDWTALSQEYGFADQSHFIRDFKKALGETPAQYAERIQKRS